MSTVEKDPQLNSMLLQNRIADLDKVSKEFDEFTEKFRADVSTKILDMATLILNAEPFITAISFTFSAGEYNDNTYDGFRTSDPNVMVREDIEVKSEYGTYTLGAGEWHWVWDAPFGNKDVSDALQSLSRYVSTMRMFISDEYGSRVRLVVDEEGLHDEPYDMG